MGILRGAMLTDYPYVTERSYAMNKVYIYITDKLYPTNLMSCLYLKERNQTKGGNLLKNTLL